MTEKIEKDSLLIMILSVLVLLGCILLPTLMIFSLLYGIFWWFLILINLGCFILALIISKTLERHNNAQKIRLKIQSKRSWMSLADFGASYGKVESRASKRKSQNSDEGWILKKVLERKRGQDPN
ncbi:MAG: hypothetical protein QXU31_03940 [Archaeoglobaceae archaeon]